jgi:hypothetical protein
MVSDYSGFIMLASVIVGGVIMMNFMRGGSLNSSGNSSSSIIPEAITNVLPAVLQPNNSKSIFNLGNSNRSNNKGIFNLGGNNSKSSNIASTSFKVT